MRTTNHILPSDECGRFPDGVVLPDDPPVWLAEIMEPWDEWAARAFSRQEPYTDENTSRYDSWRRAYALMPKSQREWDERVRRDPPFADYDGVEWDQGLRGLSRRLYALHTAEGRGIADDVHPLRGMERLLCIELAELLAFEIPRSWPGESRAEIDQRIAECRGLLCCFALWRP